MSDYCSQTKLHELPLQEGQNSVWTVLGFVWTVRSKVVGSTNSAKLGRNWKPQITNKMPSTRTHHHTRWIQFEFATGPCEFTVLRKLVFQENTKNIQHSSQEVKTYVNFLDLPVRSRSTVFVGSYLPKGLPGFIDLLTS